MDTIVAVIGLHRNLDNSRLDLSSLANIQNLNQLAEKTVSSMVSSVGGKIIGEFSGELIFEVPIDSVDVIKKIHKQLLEDFDLSTTIGVGSDAEEAKLTFRFAEDHNKGQIKVYDHDVLDYVSQQQDEQRVVGVNPDDSFRKSEDDDWEPISVEDKNRIKKFVENIKANKEIFDQMQQQAPEAYMAVVGVLNSLNLMLKEDKIKKDQKVSEIIKNLAAEIQKKRDLKARDDRADVIMQLEIEKQIKDQHKHEMRMERLRQISQEDKELRLKAHKHAKQYGGHHDFYFKLAKAFKG